jgi:predicted negative regulator of RcsB-dependent stress response
MDYQAYVDAMQQVSNQVDAGQYDDAIAGLRALLNSDLLDADKAVMCINMAVVYDKQGKASEALAWYDRGMDYERAYRRHMVSEHKAGFLYTAGRREEALEIYESLLRGRALTEHEQARIAHNVTQLRAELGRR